MDVLVTTLFRMIDQFRSTGPAKAQVADARAALAPRPRDEQPRQSLPARISSTFKYEYGEDVRDVFNMRQFYDQLTASAIRDAARLYLNTNRYVKVTLVPAGK